MVFKYSDEYIDAIAEEDSNLDKRDVAEVTVWIFSSRKELKKSGLLMGAFYAETV